MSTATAAEMTAALSAPFSHLEVRFKPAVVSGNRALAMPYIDARTVQDRLDDVLGVANWQDDYQCLEDGSVVCRLRLRLGDEWVTKVDVGSPSEQPDGGDRLKAAFSDALKRAAVKFGIGRYLYRLPPQWEDYDAARKQFVKPPRLPAAAVPRTAPATAHARAMPRDGRELKRRLDERDANLASGGRCQRGALLAAVVKAGRAHNLAEDLAGWPGGWPMHLAVDAVKDFEANLPAVPSAQSA